METGYGIQQCGKGRWDTRVVHSGAGHGGEPRKEKKWRECMGIEPTYRVVRTIPRI